jgi:hypothetical protein
LAPNHNREKEFREKGIGDSGDVDLSIVRSDPAIAKKKIAKKNRRVDSRPAAAAPARSGQSQRRTGGSVGWHRSMAPRAHAREADEQVNAGLPIDPVARRGTDLTFICAATGLCATGQRRRP